VGDTVFGVLTDVSPGMTFGASLVFMVPFLAKVFWRPGCFRGFVDGVVGCAFASFLFGWVWIFILISIACTREGDFTCADSTGTFTKTIG
jgi:hypothetical protein